MKHFIIIFLLTLLMSMIGAKASAHDIAVANADGVTIYYDYINYNTELKVSYRGSSYDSYSNEYSGDVVIPERVIYNGKTYSVTSIGYSAFSDCSGLTSVTIPNSVTSIDNWAFSGCSGLTSVTFHCKNINSCFSNHSSIKQVIIGEEVTSIGDNAFLNCSGLTSLTIGNNVTTIGKNAFYNCDLTSLTIPNNVTVIEEWAFYNNLGLSSVTFGNSIKKIEGKAFLYCEKLCTVNLPNSLEYIGESAFGHCNSLLSILLPENVTTIEKWAFQDCNSLTSISIPKSASTIGEGILIGCYKLNSIIVDSDNTHYDSRNNCNAIIETNNNTIISGCKTTTIPFGMEHIGDYAFCGIFHKIEEIPSIIIPNTIVSIGSNAFANSRAIRSIVIPAKVESIGENAFYGCESLSSVTVGHQTPATINSDCFFYAPKNILYVPKGSKAAYETATGWKDFKEIVEYTVYGDPTANTLQLTDVETYKGKQVEIPIALNNQHDITAFQFDLYLPTGVTVATKSNGKLMIETTERMEGSFTLSSNTIDNFVRVTGYSADGDSFTGSNGDILKVTLDIAESVADGDYSISLKDIVLSDVNNTEFHPADVQGKLTVKSYMLGDVDNSGAVNINDVVCIINHILNKHVSVFIAEAADVDGSGTININDVVTLINRFILQKESAPKQLAAAPKTTITDDNYLHLAPIEIKPGETLEIPLLMTNVNIVSAVQGNIKLPAGLSFVTKSNGRPDTKGNDNRAEDFTLSCAIQEDGSLTFAQYSGDGFTYEGNEGAILTFKIKADEDTAAGTYQVTLNEVVLSIEGVGYEYPDRTSTLTITPSTGIGTLLTNGLPFDIYDLNGRIVYQKQQKLTKLPKGIYIINGRTVMVK